MSSLLRDLRHALRKLQVTPLFTVVAALTLGVGIGAATAVFSVVYGVLLKPLPFADADRLVSIWHEAPAMGIDRLTQSPSLYFTYREEAETLAESGMYTGRQMSVTGLAEPEQVSAVLVTDGTLPLLGVEPALGRLFTSEEDLPGAAGTVVLTHDYWRERLGSDPGALGETLTIDGLPREVIGVLPEGFRFLDSDADLFLPLGIDRGEAYFGNFSFSGIARMKPGASLEQVNAELAGLVGVAVDTFGSPSGFDPRAEDGGFVPAAQPLKEDVVGDVGSVLWVLLGTVGLVLLVACANVANLHLVRGESRRRELATRSALGAGRRQLIRELLVESGVLGLLGGALGLFLAWCGVDVLQRLAPRGLPRLEEITVDPVVTLFALGASALAVLLFGTLPALRLGSLPIHEALKEGSRGSGAGRERGRARDVLVVVQVATALVLLVASGLMVRSFQALRSVEPGFEDPAAVQTLLLAIPESEAPGGAETARAHEAVLRALAAIPGVESAAAGSSLPLDDRRSMDPIYVEGRALAGDRLPPMRRFKWVSPGYHETLGVPLVAGRTYDWSDIHDVSPVVVISENLARAYWPRDVSQALGKRIRPYESAPWQTIVGVVGNVHDDGLDQEATPTVYWPMLQRDLFRQERFSPRSMAYALRSPRVGSPGFLDEVREAVWSVNSSLPLASVRTLEEIEERSLARVSFTLTMLGIAALAALLLGAVGIYGVTSYSVAQRTGEIGVRMALGARRRDVSRLVLRQGLVLAGIGVVVGALAAAGLTRLMSALLFGVEALDPVTYAGVGLLVTVIALAASYLPARRAAGVSPIEVLRRE